MPTTDRPFRVFFCAGEPSGDIHGANLIRALKAIDPTIEAVGYGGPEMAAAGCRLHADLTALAVMWFLQVFVHIVKFYRLYRRAARYFHDERPDAVVVIDFPGFNWWIAGAAKRQGIPVFYYCPPQIWAWASWRIKKMRRVTDHVLCCLPFEEGWFRAGGCNTTFVGHPFFDDVGLRPVDEAFLAAERAKPGRLIVILPGSRTQEVEANFAEFVRAARNLHADVPDVRFAVAAYKPRHADMVQTVLNKQTDQGHSLPPIEVHVRRTPELIRLADACMAVSGSVSLELLAHARPTVILYKISRAAFWVQKRFRRVKYITLVNLLSTGELYAKDLTPYDPEQADADRVLFPEYLTWRDESRRIADHLKQWLTDDAAYRDLVARLEALRAEVGHGGASRAAAEYIIRHTRLP